MLEAAEKAARECYPDPSTALLGPVQAKKETFKQRDLRRAFINGATWADGCHISGQAAVRATEAKKEAVRELAVEIYLANLKADGCVSVNMAIELAKQLLTAEITL